MRKVHLIGRSAVLVPLLLVTALLAPASAQVVSIQLSMTPQFPSLVTVGQTALPAQLFITNAAGTMGVSQVTLTEITLNPACGSLSLDCAPPDPGVFSLSSTATGITDACAGRTFTVTPPDANGRSLFVPNIPIVFQAPGQPNSTCAISFSFSVLKAPTIDAQPGSPGLQTAHVATVTGSGHVDPNLTAQGVARGLQTSNVNRAQPGIATQASGPVTVGDSVHDTATVSGPVAITGTVTFNLFGPDNAACTGSPPFTSTNAVSANTATSADFAPVVPGTYRFLATYSGDANNLPVAGVCGQAGETVVVGAAGGRYTPLSPQRILDTRVGIGGIAGPIGPGATADVQVSGQGGVPASGVSAVAFNVTVVQPSAGGYLTIFPTGTVRPEASNLNFVAGDTVPNLVVVKLGTGGKASVFNANGMAHVIIDVAGWFSDSGSANDGRFQPLDPSRILDTRVGIGGGTVLGPGASFDLQVAGRGGVPATGAKAAVLNVTATNTTATSWLIVYPTGEAQPVASNLNFDSGETVANRVFAKLGSSGRVTIFNNSGSTDVIVDVGGWYTDASVAGVTGTYAPLNPNRILDTRLGIGGVSGTVAAGSTTDVQITGRGGVPATGVTAVVLNVTVVPPGVGGYLTIFPTGSGQPNASDLNFGPGETRANLVVVRVGTNGRVSLFTSATTHAIFDVAGYFS